MKKITANVFFALLLAAAVSAQQTNDKTAALAVVDKMFTEMANHNPEAIKSVYAPESQLAVIVKNKDGKITARTLTGEAFSKLFAEKRGEIREDMYQQRVEIHNDLAMVWGRYVFFTDGKITHCGLNSFHLVKLADGWKIINASSTIEPDDCTTKEKKRKASLKG